MLEIQLLTDHQASKPESPPETLRSQRPEEQRKGGGERGSHPSITNPRSRMGIPVEKKQSNAWLLSSILGLSHLPPMRRFPKMSQAWDKRASMNCDILWRPPILFAFVRSTVQSSKVHK